MSAVAASMIFFAGCSSKQVDVAQDGTKSGVSTSAGKDNMTNDTAAAKAKAESDAKAAAEAEAAQGIEKANGSLKVVLFDYDKFNIRNDMMSVVEADSKILADKRLDSAKIKLEGNADERGSDEYNFALG